LPIANEAALTRGDAIPIAYQLKITQDGLLSLAYSYNGGAFQRVISSQNIKQSNGLVPSNLRFGFAGSTGGATNIHEILCFQANPANLASTSVGVNDAGRDQDCQRHAGVSRHVLSNRLERPADRERSSL
jgi:type IV pilus assembly protein PilY1